jgi:hypothetical protein
MIPWEVANMVQVITDRAQQATQFLEARVRPDMLSAARAFGVAYGAALLLDLALGACVIGTARGVLARSSQQSRGRRLRELAALGTSVAIVYVFGIRPWLLRWGATHEELHQPLPGDALVPEPWIQSTRAITIHAPVEAVWPWLAQIGQDRGGFYSYEWLENLAGCEMHNADRIHPEWQQRAVGEIVRLHPQTGLRVALFEPNRVLALEGWGAFVLEPVDAHTTRLITRSRAPRGPLSVVLALVGEIPHFVMERGMLLGIKRRAEAACAQG